MGFDFDKEPFEIPYVVHTMVEPHKIKETAKKHENKNTQFRAFLKNRADPGELDQQFRDLHNEIFIRDEYDCCKCANCCKSYDIRVEQSDIPAIAKHLGQAESDFIGQYLAKDEIGVYVVKDKPCSFLESDGKCRIYGVRPSVCRDFPHTKKSDRLFSLLSTISYAEECPVVFEIIERLKRIYNFR